MTPFEQAVIAAVKAIPKGTTASYARVALFAGKPGAARGVVRALRVGPKGLPWWRVVRSDGTLAKEVAHEQARRLRKEGIEIRGRRVVVRAGSSPSGAARRPRASRR